jgi:hypothetical protein
MSNWPELNIVARTAERETDRPLIPDVYDEFLKRVDELAVGILRGAVHQEHGAAGTIQAAICTEMSSATARVQPSLCTYHSLHVIELIPRQEAPTNKVVPQDGINDVSQSSTVVENPISVIVNSKSSQPLYISLVLHPHSPPKFILPFSKNSKPRTHQI